MRVLPGWELVKKDCDAGLILAGVDEVGRGAWAGPVVAASVIFSNFIFIPGLADSKAVPKSQHSALDLLIRDKALAVGVGWVNSKEVDAIGLGDAIRLSGIRALAALDIIPGCIILDGKHNYLHDDKSRAIVAADALVVPVAAASIIAKVARDRYMLEYHHKHPDYGFDSHVGYGTQRHRESIARHGITAEHRKSVKPIARYIQETGLGSS